MLFVCNSNKSHSFIFKLGITIVHTLKMCAGDAGPEQSLFLFPDKMTFFHLHLPEVPL